ncbi:MAG TPA: hypothetical protein DCZ94_12890 [Lentisphaeria bacterium]|nr:MAG: hypothetical protein A2X48_00965 [Lentisphaerae bacterium GWF2_49_21]HBC87844.1 hypothetical protein [Lentisphaeria bacterium]
MKNFLIIISLLAGGLALSGAEPVEGAVKANVLNVRVKPGEKYAVVAQLGRNDKVKILNFEKGWYEISAPAKCSVWISAAFVRDGVVMKKAYIRTGPSVACSPYAMLLEQGIKVDILDTTQEGWLKISAVEGLTAWVNAEYVDVDPVQAGALKEGKQDDPAPVVKPEEKKDKEPDRKNNEADKMSFSGIAPKAVSYEGLLVPVKPELGTGAVSFALADKTDDHYFPVCYVFSRRMNLKLWENKTIQVTGQERWVRGWHKPVVEVDLVNAVGAL